MLDVYRPFRQQKGLPTPELFGSTPCTRPVSMNNYEECGRLSWSEKFRRQSVESGGDLNYVKGRKVKMMDRETTMARTSRQLIENCVA